MATKQPQVNPLYPAQLMAVSLLGVMYIIKAVFGKQMILRN